MTSAIPKSIDPFLGRVKSDTYNCLDFTREVWLYLQGEDVKAKLDKLVRDVANGKVTAAAVKGFERLRRPIDPCFIVLQRSGFVPHVGIYLDGRMLHLTNRGVELRSINVAKGNFSIVRYYR